MINTFQNTLISVKFCIQLALMNTFLQGVIWFLFGDIHYETPCRLKFGMQPAINRTRGHLPNSKFNVFFVAFLRIGIETNVKQSSNKKGLRSCKSCMRVIVIVVIVTGGKQSQILLRRLRTLCNKVNHLELDHLMIPILFLFSASQCCWD